MPGTVLHLVADQCSAVSERTQRDESPVGGDERACYKRRTPLFLHGAWQGRARQVCREGSTMVRVRTVAALLLFAPSVALAQSQRAIEVRAIHHDVSPPLRDMPPIPWRLGEFEAEPAKPIPSRRQPPGGPDEAVQGKRFAPVAGQAPATALNRDGIGSGF